MNPNEDSIGNLLNSFKAVCSELEKKADVDLIRIKNECKAECVESEKAMQKFNELTSRIAEVCSELNNNSEILNLARTQTNDENTLNLPYEMHFDLVKCIGGLYNDMYPTGPEPKEKLVTKKKEELVKNLIMVGRKITNEVKVIESSVIEAKENLKALRVRVKEETCQKEVAPV